ncbi:hypothetical protein EDD22DRAFT_898670, partial [Suillus occidentalis]
MINKGSIGLFMTMMLTAHRSSPATADVLMKELSISQPALMGRLIHTTKGLTEFGFAKVFERVAGSLEGDRKDVETLKTGVEKSPELQGIS